MKTLIKSRKNEVGATAIEYGLIAALISVAIIAAVSTVGTNLKDVFTNVGTTLAEASSAG
ncbi:Flp family type IVb pilin [Gluconacetobacter sp.]|uniref:Flp family type IVb pilin n=1 Tax=Gluconacetobacter sp. TaxID=1935994 RepID=UPI0039E8F7B1